MDTALEPGMRRQHHAFGQMDSRNKRDADGLAACAVGVESTDNASRASPDGATRHTGEPGRRYGSHSTRSKLKRNRAKYRSSGDCERR